jgi:membrane protease YdiL (CAAX protease family)
MSSSLHPNPHLAAPHPKKVFWRGFFLASLTKVLPPPAAAAASSLNFAALHLSPAAGPSLLLLSGCCDALYLRSHNLAAPLLLHGAWNAAQVLGVAFLGKQEFV